MKTLVRSPLVVASSEGFRFDPVAHAYYAPDGARVPNITGMLEFCGYVDTEWLTEESRIRGQAVHTLTARYDLGAFPDLKTSTSPYKGWVLAHAEAMADQTLGFSWDMIEQALYHPQRRFGGRPDRVGLRGRVRPAKCLVDIKSGAREPWHRLQTALQAILVAAQPGQLPAQYWERYALYEQEDGGWQCIEHPDPYDIQEAHGIIDDVCGVAA